ncbi:phosphodiesterase [Tabrizicola sp. J26]|uniref:glycerophosphodiester phosphodiesterase family protein n=1 Tax=Alitabrizicola rongguiensis TaxID=2909234 RepID=UPI001F34F4FD|nr:glycerophosphodiester phosphodiesterase family protein [Tabrizicola rongguiensis]MCF1707744.1 phosphodiesterase [Tabrizicola rongguiensis]
MSIVPLPKDFLRAPFAHRGLHDKTKGRIENSLSAFSAAVAAGYGIELDLQLTKDGTAVVFHDATLDRVTGESGPVADRTAAELGRIALNGSTDTIPSFAEVLLLAAGRVPLLVELKDQSHNLTETDGRLESAAAEALLNYSGSVALMSFNPHSVAWMQKLCPRLPRGITTGSYPSDEWEGASAARSDELREIPDYDRTGSSFISHEVADLTRPRVAELKAKGARILCWTVRSADMEAEARRVAQNITFEGYPAKIPA